MNNYTIEILKYYCDELDIDYSLDLIETEGFKKYLKQWNDRRVEKSQLEMNKFENALVDFFRKVEKIARQKKVVEIVVEKGQKKKIQNTVKSYLKAHKCHAKLKNYIKVVEKEDSKTTDARVHFDEYEQVRADA